MSKKRIVRLGVVIGFLFLLATQVFAAEECFGFDDGRVFVDEDVSLEPGERFSGDLAVFGGDLTIPQGSTVNGDVFVSGGTVLVAGRVNGDLAVTSGDLLLDESGYVAGDVFGLGKVDVGGQVGGDLANLFGSVVLRNTAVVHGDLLALSGSVEREPGATVLGDEVAGAPLPGMPRFPEEPAVPEVRHLTPEPPQLPVRPSGPTLGQRIGRFVSRSLAATFLGLLFVGLGLLIVYIWPRQTQQVSDCITALPWQSFGLGLLTYLIALGLESLAVVLMILVILVAAALISTVILIPVGLFLILISGLVLLPVPLALVGAMVLGWVGLADLVGRKVLALLNVRDVKPAGAVLVGLLLSVGLAATFWLLKPLCCGWPFIVLMTSIGLGAVLNSRFGTQSCRESPAAPPSEPLPLEAMDEEAGRPDAA